MEKRYKKVGKRYVEVVENCRFNIDFFEFSFLVEACIPPRPIARTMFWQEVIDKYYHVLTKNERERLYEWMNRNLSYTEGVEKGNEDCLWFEGRFNPARQKTITTNFNGEIKEIEAFTMPNDDRYYTKRNTWIQTGYIMKSE